MTAIYLVQHGDKERVPGDPGLTELGRDQAATTARWRQVRGLHALYSSPLRRDLVLGNGESSRSAGERLRVLLRTLLGDERLPYHLLAEGADTGHCS